MYDENLIEHQEITLKRFRYEISKMIAEEALVNSEVCWDNELKALRIIIKKDILGRVMNEIKHTSTWQDGLREAIYKRADKIKWPFFIIRAYKHYRIQHPVNYTVYEVREYYPEISIPEETHYIKFERIK